ncbi:DEAD/DEAH box helicase [Salinifilum aidingensis]
MRRPREAIILTFTDYEAGESLADQDSETHAPATSADSAPAAETQQDVTPDTPTFAELDVHPEIVRALGESDIEHTFAIQELTLPLALRGEDIIGQARTGTGKTLGFGVPLLHRLELPGDGTPQALVVVPTRELCMQVTRDLEHAGKHLGVRTLSIYGGRPYEEQISALREGVDVVVGTPGRLLDLAEKRHLVLGKVRGLVLDEADEMLDLGFLPDVERILRMVPEQRQTMLFSATMPGPVLTLARTFMPHPTHIRAEQADEGAIHERTKQLVYRAHAMDKDELIARALQARSRGLAMIFARTKRSAQKLADELAERGFAASAVHGDLGQEAREKALRAFRSGKSDVLVATDVAARGIDVSGVTHVINLQCPEDEKTYVHRIGRTGRAGREGVAITLVDWDEESRWKLINDSLGLDQPTPVETYSTSAHLFEDLDIPAGTLGRLPASQRPKRSEPGSGAAKRDKSRQRSRRRTRGGVEQRSTETEAGSRPDGGEGRGSDESRPSGRRRRRTRGGAPASASTGGESTAETASADESEQSGTRTRTRRRRRRGSGNRSPREGAA